MGRFASGPGRVGGCWGLHPGSLHHILGLYLLISSVHIGQEDYADCVRNFWIESGHGKDLKRLCKHVFASFIYGFRGSF
jgi:hypothetical protein